MSDPTEHYVDRALKHLHHLAVEIGPRPPTREGERRAAEYAAQVMRAAGLRDVRLEPFASGRSTYWPYTLAIGAGLLVQPALSAEAGPPQCAGGSLAKRPGRARLLR